MNLSKLNSRISGNTQIIKILSKNGEISNIPGFLVAFRQLNSSQKKINDKFSIFSSDSMTLEKARNNSRKELLEAIMPVVNIMQIFAFDRKKKKLRKQLESFNTEYFQKCSDKKLVNISKKIWMISNKYCGYTLDFFNKNKSLINAYKSKSSFLKNRYGLTTEMIRKIEEANIKFIESLLLYEDELTEKNKILKNVKKADRKIEKLLEYKIDRYMSLFENVNPDLFKEYQKLRLEQFKGEAGTIEKITESENLPIEKDSGQKAKKHQKITIENKENAEKPEVANVHE